MKGRQRIVVATAVAVGAVGVVLASGMGLSAAAVDRPIARTTTDLITDMPVPTTAPAPTTAPSTTPEPTVTEPGTTSTAPVPTTTDPVPTTTTPPPVCVTPTTTTVVAAVALFADDDAEKEAVKARLKKWAETLSGDNPSAKDMGAFYAEKAVLHPTLSPVVRTSRTEIEKYFEEDFLPKKPKLDPDKGIDRKQLEVKGTIAIDSGIYTFTDKDGKVIKARYVFVYEKTNCGWIIIHHSSSELPQAKK